MHINIKTNVINIALVDSDDMKIFWHASMLYVG
jgi:hypothetical protein